MSLAEIWAIAMMVFFGVSLVAMIVGAGRDIARRDREAMAEQAKRGVAKRRSELNERL